MLGRSGAVEDGLFAGGQLADGVGRGALDLVKRNEDGAGSAPGKEGTLAAHVDQDGATGGDGLTGGTHVDARRVRLGGGYGGLAEGDSAGGERGEGRQGREER